MKNQHPSAILIFMGDNLSSPSKVIVLVDDSEHDAVLLQQNLVRAGLANPVIWLSSGEQAIAYLNRERAFDDRDCSPLPAILLLDLRMPEMTGFEVLEWIRQQPRLRNLLVVVLSALDDTASVQRAYSLGANSFLSKPANSQELQHTVQFFKGCWEVDQLRPHHQR